MGNSVKPSFAGISVGLRRREVLKRLEDSEARVYRTVNGAVTFYLDGHAVTPWLAALDECRFRCQRRQFRPRTRRPRRPPTAEIPRSLGSPSRHPPREPG